MSIAKLQESGYGSIQVWTHPSAVTVVSCRIVGFDFRSLVSLCTQAAAVGTCHPINGFSVEKTIEKEDEPRKVFPSNSSPKSVPPSAWGNSVESFKREEDSDRRTVSCCWAHRYANERLGRPKRSTSSQQSS